MSTTPPSPEQLRTRERFEPDELDSLWASLEAVRLDELWGSWRGRELPTGHALSRMLRKIAWVGKRFVSPLDVQPLVCRRDDGTLYSNTDLGKGEASVWMVEFRGVSTATMVYDGSATFDHFKRVDDRTLLGIMNGKNALFEGRHFYFLLERAEIEFELG
jgi:hypothetical protein